MSPKSVPPFLSLGIKKDVVSRDVGPPPFNWFFCLFLEEVTKKGRRRGNDCVKRPDV